MRNRLSPRPSVTALAVICAVLAATLTGCQPSAPAATALSAPTTPAKASNPDVISAEASVVPVRESELSFRVSGKINTVLVAEGDQVTKGQELARLDSSDLELARQQAEAQLKAAQANLARARAGARAEEIKVSETALAIAQANARAANDAVKIAEANVGSAQAGVTTAQANLARARAGATPEQLNAATAVLANADAALRQAQAAYDKIKNDPNRGLMPQSLQLEQATNEYNRAQASFQNVKNGATPAEINVYYQQVVQAQAAVPVAQAQLAQARSQAEAAAAQAQQAQAQLDLVKAGARAEDVAVAEASVAQAQVGVDQARHNLENVVLTAPFDGTIGTVNAQEGQIAGPQVPVMSIGDLSKLQVKTKDLSEADVNLVKVGQDVSVSLDAIQGRKFTGKVVRVAPVASDNRGDKVYAVTIDVDAAPDAGLRWGMTAFVEIKVH